jgi:3-oxoacyl-[acyl-carrier protein] reductase
MGRATAHLFADEGALVLVVDRNPVAVQAVVDEIGAAHGSGAAIGVSADVSKGPDHGVKAKFKIHQKM